MALAETAGTQTVDEEQYRAAVRQLAVYELPDSEENANIRSGSYAFTEDCGSVLGFEVERIDVLSRDQVDDDVPTQRRFIEFYSALSAKDPLFKLDYIADLDLGSPEFDIIAANGDYTNSAAERMTGLIEGVGAFIANGKLVNLHAPVSKAPEKSDEDEALEQALKQRLKAFVEPRAKTIVPDDEDRYNVGEYFYYNRDTYAVSGQVLGYTVGGMIVETMDLVIDPDPTDLITNITLYRDKECTATLFELACRKKVKDLQFGFGGFDGTFDVTDYEEFGRALDDIEALAIDQQG